MASRVEKRISWGDTGLDAALRPQCWTLIALACVAAVLIRCWGIGSRSFWMDEAYSAWFISLSWSELWFETPRYEPHPPAYYSLLKLWSYLAGESSAALRGLSALAGIATVAVVGLAAKELALLTRSRRPLLLVAIACALAALSPRLLVIGQDARPYALLVLAYGVAILGLLRLARTFRDEEAAPGRVADWALLGASTVAVLWLHGLGILFAGALLGALLILALPHAGRGRWQRLLVTVAIAAILYLPCLLMMLGRAGDWSSGWLAWNRAAFLPSFFQLYGLHAHEEGMTPRIAFVLIPFLALVALRRLRTAHAGLAPAMALLLLLPPLGAAILSELGTPVFLPRTLVPVLLPAYLLVAFAVSEHGRRADLAVAGVLAAAFLLNLGQTLRRPSQEPWADVAAAIQREMAPGDRIWAYPNDAAIPLERALGSGRSLFPVPAAFPALQAPGVRRLGSPGVVMLVPEQARRWRLAQAPVRGTIWLVRRPSRDPGSRILAELAQGRRLGRPRRWPGVVLVPLYPAQPVSPATRSSSGAAGARGQ